MLIGIGIAVLLVVFILFSAIKIVQQYELGVVFRLGRLVGTRKPGITLIIPFIDRIKKMDTRVMTIDVPKKSSLKIM